ncbi:HD domain-containing protein [Vibrio harveyi]|uniref:HD domain-containing protein n=1 Tax=Vibrio harveyi TaxID=669 RepID=UPI003CFAA595
MTNEFIQNASYKDVIMCPVHGAINVHEHEIATINHPLFQRLRDVMQNDILHYIFMGATHTRFSHSIGTMHIASKVFHSIISNKRNKELGSKLRLTRAQERAVNYLSQVLRLAMLLHDTGHGAFSHQLEKTPAILTEILGKPETAQQLWDGVDTSKFYSALPLKMCHEHYSVRAAHKILTDVKLEKFNVEVSDVLNVMETTDGKPSEQFMKATKELWPIIAGSSSISDEDKAIKLMHVLELIISNEFDADKADYLMRDSHYAGVNYGKFDLDTLVNNFSIEWIEDEKWLGLAINKKVIGVLENFVFSRYSMYLHVYNHKTTNGFELILSSAIEELLMQKDWNERIKKCLSNIDCFEDFSDSMLWMGFKTLAKEEPDSYCAKLIKRVRIPFIGSYKLDSSSDPLTLIKGISKEYGIDEGDIKYRILKTKFSKICCDFVDIRVIDRNPVSKREIVRKISDVSGFFDLFSDLSQLVVHYENKKASL